MPITFSGSLTTEINDKNLTKLLILIKKYNEKPGLTRLQQIEVQANLMHEEFLKNPQPHLNKFERWFSRNPIGTELVNIFEDTNQYTNNRVFEMASRVRAPMDFNDFNELKENLKKFNYRSADNLPYNIHQAMQRVILAKAAIEHNNTPINNQRYIESLRALVALAISAINAAPDSKTTFRKFAKIVDRLNSEINQVVNNLNLQDSPRHLRSFSPIPALDEKMNSPNLPDLVRQLLDNQTFVIGNFEFKAIGGNNNKNWLSKNEETGERYIIRLEGGRLPAEHIVASLQSNSTINRYIANDYAQYSTPILDDGKEWNIAISEFCPKKDVLSFRYSLTNETSEVIIDKVLAMTEQVANFTSTLNDHHLAYTDIKAENFLLRENEEVVTADKKSIVFQSNDNRLALYGAESSIAISYRFPEHLPQYSPDGTCSAEAFMAYEIGVMLHVLMTGDKDNKPNGTASYIDHQKGQIENLNFDYAIYQTPAGEQVKNLVGRLTAPDPADRPSLTEVINSCLQIRMFNNFIQNAPPVDVSSLPPIRAPKNTLADAPINLRDSLTIIRTELEEAEENNPLSQESNIRLD